MSDSGTLLSMPRRVAVAERSNSDNEKCSESFIRIKIKLINIVIKLAYIRKKQYFCRRIRIKHVNIFFNEHGSNGFYGYQTLSNNQFNSQGAFNRWSIIKHVNKFLNEHAPIGYNTDLTDK